MPNIDSFSAQLVAMVRNMSDEAILELVLHKLTADEAPAPKPAARPAAPAPQKARPAKKAKKKAPARPTPAAAKPASQPKPAAPAPTAKPSDASKEALIAAVEKAIKKSNGLGLAAVSAAVGEPKARVSSAIRDLKDQKKIFQAGDRRFARYAGDFKTAKAATIRARTGK